MKNSIRGTIAIGVLAGAAAFISANAGAGRELIFSAPIEKLDRGTDTVTVLGQSFHADTSQLTVGQVVRVYGELAKDGSVKDAVVQSTQSFGANGDPVFLKGVVTDANPALGHIEVDGMTVDYTSQLANSNFAPPAVGDVVAISGTQPAVQGLLVASATGDAAYANQVAGGTATFGQASSGLTSSLASSGLAKAQITGGGAAQITGGGAAQITGGGAAQITGGGAAQITGGGAAQITGGGAAQITGGGAAQITGGGAAQITGGGAAQITGGGAAQITGGGAAQITGGGLAGAEVTGGAHAAQITGGGR